MVIFGSLSRTEDRHGLQHHEVEGTLKGFRPAGRFIRHANEVSPAPLDNQMKCDEWSLPICDTYLTIANEVPAPGQPTTHTTLYRSDLVKN